MCFDLWSPRFTFEIKNVELINLSKISNEFQMGTVTNNSNGMKKIENESNFSFDERKFWKKKILNSYQFDTEIEKMETADVTQVRS